MNTSKNNCAVAIKKTLKNLFQDQFVNILLYKKFSYTYFCRTRFFQKLPLFDSTFANIFERFDNFMNFLYSG